MYVKHPYRKAEILEHSGQHWWSITRGKKCIKHFNMLNMTPCGLVVFFLLLQRMDIFPLDSWGVYLTVSHTDSAQVSVLFLLISESFHKSYFP